MRFIVHKELIAFCLNVPITPCYSRKKVGRLSDLTGSGVLAKQLTSQFENNRQMILDATSRLFCEKGVDATSFSDISHAVKLSKGTIYYYYPSKDHLIFDAAEYHLNRITDGIFAWLGAVAEDMPLEDTLLALLTAVFQDEDACRLHICLVNYSIMGNDAIKNIMRERIDRWHTMAEVGLSKTGYAKPLTDAVFTAIDSIILHRALGILDINEKQIGEHIARHVWK